MFGYTVKSGIGTTGVPSAELPAGLHSCRENTQRDSDFVMRFSNQRYHHILWYNMSTIDGTTISPYQERRLPPMMLSCQLRSQDEKGDRR